MIGYCGRSLRSSFVLNPGFSISPFLHKPTGKASVQNLETMTRISISKHSSIEKDQFKPYLDEEFSPRMRNASATEKPWLPAEKLIQEMKECLYFKYGSASDEDFKVIISSLLRAITKSYLHVN